MCKGPVAQEVFFSKAHGVRKVEGKWYDMTLTDCLSEGLCLTPRGKSGGTKPEPCSRGTLSSVRLRLQPSSPTYPLTSRCSGGVSRIRATSRATFPCPRITAVSQLRSGAS